MYSETCKNEISEKEKKVNLKFIQAIRFQFLNYSKELLTNK